MEDKRVSWMKQRIYAGLTLTDDELFDNLLARDEKRVGKELITFLDQPSDEFSPAIIFYCIQHEVEEMVEVVEGTKICSL